MPAELEGLILSHPDIEDVAVMGVHDERAGEVPRAFVVRKQGTQISQQDIMDFVKGIYDFRGYPFIFCFPPKVTLTTFVETSFLSGFGIMDASQLCLILVSL